MSRFSALSLLPENSMTPPPAPKLKAVSRGSIIPIFDSFVARYLSVMPKDIKSEILLLVCKFYGLSTEQYENERVHYDVEFEYNADDIVQEYEKLNIDKIIQEFEYPSLASSNPYAEYIRETFKKLTKACCETEKDKHQREFVEFKSILSDFWLSSQPTEYDDGEFNLDAYTAALSFIMKNPALFPDLPFHYKANAFIDVIGPRVYCAESQIFFVPHIGTTEYADSCEHIHRGFTDVLIVTNDSDIVAYDSFVESITCE